VDLLRYGFQAGLGQGQLAFSICVVNANYSVFPDRLYHNSCGVAKFEEHQSHDPVIIDWLSLV
jgi:hypothetical protein